MGSLSRGVSVQEMSVQGFSVQGVSVQRVSVQEFSVQWGLCLEGVEGVSVQGISVQRGSLCRGGSLSKETPYGTIKSGPYASYWNASLSIKSHCFLLR